MRNIFRDEIIVISIRGLVHYCSDFYTFYIISKTTNCMEISKKYLNILYTSISQTPFVHRFCFNYFTTLYRSAVLFWASVNTHYTLYMLCTVWHHEEHIVLTEHFHQLNLHNLNSLDRDLPFWKLANPYIIHFNKYSWKAF